MIINAALQIINKGLDLAFPDTTEADNAKRRLAEMALKGELDDLQNEFQLAMGQLEVNKAEATHADMFVSGWRPFVGWVCGGAFAWNYILSHIVIFFAQVAGIEITPIQLDLSEMMPVLLGMLGLGGYRSYEKAKGVARAKL